MIGVKSVVAAGFLALAIALAAAGGVLNGAHLDDLGRAACLVVGAFAALAAALASQLWRPRERSRWYVGVARGGSPSHDEAALLEYRGATVVVGADVHRARFELPAWAQHAAFVAAFAAFGLVAFDNRTTARLTSVPASLGELSLTAYCEDEVAAPAPPPSAVHVVDVRGCALIRRAYELGYADSLGECAPREVAIAAVPAAEERCALRRRDEPFLHYAWRVLADRTGDLAGVAPVDSLRRSAHELDVKLGYLGSLFAEQGHAVRGSPRASHHLWTNLPDPRGSSVTRMFTRDDCFGRYANLELELDWRGHSSPASAVVEHAFGQLLFSPRFGSPPGNCREYVIHWSAPEDACRRLAADPAEYLAEADALAPVRRVLDRRRRRVESNQLATALGDDPRPEPFAPTSVVSFQCFIVGPARSVVRADHAFSLDGLAVVARELRTPEVNAGRGGQLAVYQQLATLLAGSRYAGPARERGIERITEQPPSEADLAGDGFLLTRLETLRTADPFLGTAWPLERPDLAPVYPVQHHLQNFIDAFRRRYQAQRGRL